MSVPNDLRATVENTGQPLSALLTGDPEAYKALWSRASDVTVPGGFGGHAVGWDQVKQDTDWAASRFRGGRLSELELLAAGESGDLAYTVWLERGEVRVEGRDEPGRLVRRVTHLFRREDGAWKIIHRHGDAVVEKTAAAAVLQR